MQSIDVLASAIHDAKNQLFFADSLAATAAEQHGFDMNSIRDAMEHASSRLTRALLAYRLGSGMQPLSISAVAVHGLMEDAISICHPHYAHLGLALDSHCGVDGVWPLDRDLILDAIGNGLENAARFARAQVRLSAGQKDGMLSIRIEDDGPGVSDASPPAYTSSGSTGLGLHIGRQIARMHLRHGRHGELRLVDGSSLGGAAFELTLP